MGGERIIPILLLRKAKFYIYRLSQATREEFEEGIHFGKAKPKQESKSLCFYLFFAFSLRFFPLNSLFSV
jgi:hypothetical protein